jgi:hypothetical protein
LHAQLEPQIHPDLRSSWNSARSAFSIIIFHLRVQQFTPLLEDVLQSLPPTAEKQNLSAFGVV